MRVAVLAAAVCAVLAPSASAVAQGGRPRFGADLPSGGEAEEYLRYLQTTGEVAPHPWSLRGFGPDEADRLLPPERGHPWAGRGVVRHDTTRAAVRLLPVELRSWYNSDFPFATNDGPVWAGRGATVSVQAGVSVRTGPLSLVVAPVAFVAENREFPLMGNGLEGERSYADGRHRAIDLPQRYGSGAYSRVDPGQSTLRLDARGLALGVSTAGQVWGPASEHPLILGTGGPGFPHLFAGTSRPANVGVGRLHARLVYGRLQQSAHSPIQEGRARERFMSGIVGTLQPRGLTGLEVGASRFFHTSASEGGLSFETFAAPLSGILNSRNNGAENQLASIFFRWVAAPAGIEVYGEYARDDYNVNLRDLILEPEHVSAYSLGLRRAWRPAPTRMVALRAETMDARLSRLMGHRTQAPLYTHGPVLQGHTQRGQLLGSRAAYGGAGSIVALDVYHPGGRWTGMWMREQRGIIDRVWVAHVLGAEALFTRGRAELRTRILGVWDLNYYYQPRDRFNLNTEVGVQWRP